MIGDEIFIRFVLGIGVALSGLSYNADRAPLKGFLFLAFLAVTAVVLEVTA